MSLGLRGVCGKRPLSITLARLACGNCACMRVLRDSDHSIRHGLAIVVAFPLCRCRFVSGVHAGGGIHARQHRLEASSGQVSGS
jgi:hypothetical protein